MDEVPTVVFVFFENEYTPVGGLDAVMKFLPIAISKSCKTALSARYK